MQAIVWRGVDALAKALSVACVARRARFGAQVSMRMSDCIGLRDGARRYCRALFLIKLSRM